MQMTLRQLTSQTGSRTRSARTGFRSWAPRSTRPRGPCDASRIITPQSGSARHVTLIAPKPSKQARKQGEAGHLPAVEKVVRLAGDTRVIPAQRSHRQCLKKTRRAVARATSEVQWWQHVLVHADARDGERRRDGLALEARRHPAHERIVGQDACTDRRAEKPHEDDESTSCKFSIQEPRLTTGVPTAARNVLKLQRLEIAGHVVCSAKSQQMTVRHAPQNQ